MIRHTDKSMTNIQYKVDDMTSAPMDVKQWVDTEVSIQMFYLFADRFQYSFASVSISVSSTVTVLFLKHTSACELSNPCTFNYFTKGTH